MPKKARGRLFRPKSYWKENKKKANINACHSSTQLDHNYLGKSSNLPASTASMHLDHAYCKSSNCDLPSCDELDHSPEAASEIDGTCLSLNCDLPSCDDLDHSPEAASEIEVVSNIDIETIPSEDAASLAPADKEEICTNNSSDNVPASNFTTNEKDMGKIMGDLASKLPSLWSAFNVIGGITIQCFSPHESRMVQRSLLIKNDGSYKVFIHGVLLPTQHKVYTLPKLDFKQMSLDEVSICLIQAVGALRVFEVSCGVINLKYQELWKKTENCVVDNNIFKEMRYEKTCRANNCERIVTQPKRKCTECLKLAKTFSVKLSKQKAAISVSPSGRVQTPHKNKPYSSLSTPEKEARTGRYMKDIRNLKKQNSRLHEKLSKSIEKEGVNVDEDMDIFLYDVLTDPDNEEQVINSSEFLKIFLHQQIQARNLKNKCGMRWHPLMIRFALHVKMQSAATYRSLRGFIELPSERVLYDYSHVYDVKEGCNNSIIQNVGEEVAKFVKDYQKYHTFLFDEIYIQQNLVAKKSDGSVIGYCHLDKVNEEILALQNLVEAEAQNIKETPIKSPPIAKTMMTYMVKGTASGVKDVVAAYSINLLTKEDVFTHTWEVIERCELSGIRIMALVCDGSPINRSFIDMNPPLSTDSNVIYDTANPYDPSRAIYFISDVPHLLKTLRNCFSSSGMKNSRKLYKNGQHILWSTIVDLFNLKSDQTIKKLHKLDAAAVFLNKFSCQKTIYAFRVISKSVANAIEQLGWPETQETCIVKKN